MKPLSRRETVKRNMELIREMVLLLEAEPEGWAPRDIVERLEKKGYSREGIQYHTYLLVDGGLAVGVDVTHSGSSGPEYLLRHLTWAGHDFADACRADGIWKNARKIISEKLGSVSFDVLKALLKALAMGALNIT